MLVYVIDMIREEKGISLEVLSKETDIDIKLLSEIENNKTGIVNDEMLTSIANALKVSTDELFYTVYDYDKVRKNMEELINKEGINSIKARKLNVVLDELHNIMLRNNSKIDKYAAYNKEE